eukprot:2059658-Amphidinium_carterae.1
MAHGGAMLIQDIPIGGDLPLQAVHSGVPWGATANEPPGGEHQAKQPSFSGKVIAVDDSELEEMLYRTAVDQ